MTDVMMESIDETSTIPVDDGTVNPLPYVIVFAILVLIGLIILTWTLDVWFKANQCFNLPNIWCSDTWTCNNACPANYAGNSCFITTGTATVGLASCIYGPNTSTAKLCFAAPTGGTPGSSGADATSCACTPGMSSTNNCMSGCAPNLKSISSGGQQPTCCCTDTNNSNCTQGGVCTPS